MYIFQKKDALPKDERELTERDLPSITNKVETTIC